MINTRDEIMRKFAADISDIDPERFPETTRMLQEPDMERFPEAERVLHELESEEAKQKQEEPIPSAPRPPISQREQRRQFVDPFEERGLVPGKHEGAGWPWEDPYPGSIEWVAQNHTQEYLRGVNKPYRGYARDPQYDEVTKVTMDRLIAVDPSKYFDWGLRMRQELKAWMVPAAEALIDKDPYTALIKSIYNQGEEIKHLLPKLWKDVLEVELKRSSETESGQIFPGTLFNRMRELAGELARTNPEFYIDEIAESGIGRKFRTKRFDSWASNALRDR